MTTGRAWGRAFRLMRHIPVGLVIAVVGLVGFTIATRSFNDRLASNLIWKTDVVVERESRLVGSIFEIANAQIKLRREPGSGRFVIDGPRCEDLMTAGTGSIDEKTRNALMLLCESDQGKEIRAEIEAWNGSYNFVGIRDNRSQEASCDNTGRPAGERTAWPKYFLPRGCKRNVWKAEIGSGDDLAPVPFNTLSDPPISDFAFVADPESPVPFEGDWAILSPDTRDVASPYRLEDTLPMTGGKAPKEIAVDLIGRLASISIDGSPDEAVTTTDPSKTETHTIKGVSAEIWFDCDEHERKDVVSTAAEPDEQTVDPGMIPPRCASRLAEAQKRKTRQPLPPPHAAFVYQIRLRLAPGGNDRGVKVTLNAESEPTIPESMRVASLRDGGAKHDLDQGRPAPSGGKFELARGPRHLRVDCEAGWKEKRAWEKKCHLAWRHFDENALPPPFRVLVGCENNAPQDVFDPQTGELNEEFFNLGFAPLVGFSPADWGSLAWALGTGQKAEHGASPCKPPPTAEPPGPPKAHAPPRIVPLTIDPALQRAALEILSHAQYLQCRNPRDLPREKRINADPAATPLCLRRLHRAAALVVLDDADAPGAIRALASWPPVPRNLSAWDLAALSEDDTTFAGFGWRAVGRDNVPGSTFKAATSIAAISALTAPGLFTSAPDDKDKLAKVLRGDLSESETRLLLGVHRAPRAAGSWVRGNGDACLLDAKAGAMYDTVPAFGKGLGPAYCAQNDGLESFWNGKANLGTHCPGNRETKGAHLGMCEGLVISSNLFFGGLGRRLEDFVHSPPASPLLPDPDSETLLSATARRLSFGLDVVGRQPEIDDGCAGPWRRPDGARSGFDLTRGVAAAPKLNASPIVISGSSPNCQTENPVPQVQSGFGLSVTATPLAMATIYASVGRNRIVRPSIVVMPRDSGCPVDRADGECGPLIPGAAPDADDYFSLMREGFHGVPIPGVGTMGRTLISTQQQLERGAGERLFVKTGTATAAIVGKASFYSLWVAGWVEGGSSRGALQVSKTRAFSCVVTNQKTGYGGSACGPIVKDLIGVLGREGQP